MINTNRIISSTTIVVIALIAIIMVFSSNSSGVRHFFTFSHITYGQSSANTTTTGNTSNNSPLPVLLIHGYMEDAIVWNKWIDLLKKDGISAYPIHSNNQMIN